MKRIFIALLMCISMLDVMAFNDSERPVAFASLPQQARSFITTHFPDVEVVRSLAEKDLFSLEYEVTLANGFSVEFDRKGNWTEIDCKQSVVPAKLVPAQIQKYVSENYSGNKILKIEKDRNEYEINLSNGVEIKFNQNFLVIDID